MIQDTNRSVISTRAGTVVETRYAKSGQVSIAYQVVGEGALDLVLVPGWVSHVEAFWEEPSFARFLRRLSSFSRLIVMDRRGTGLSVPAAQLPTLEERIDDVRAVMDAAGSERAALLGVSEGGPMCSLFAATHPERTAALVLYGTFATGLEKPDYPWGLTEEVVEAFLKEIDEGWGQGISARLFAPSLAQDERFVKRWSRLERLAVSPGSARTLLQIAAYTDVRDILPSIRVPTLVLHRSEDAVIPVAAARYLAEHIPDAKYVELTGCDHFFWVGDTDAPLGEIEEFLTGVRRGAESDRVLATVLFTDIVGSTVQAAKLGDSHWRSLLERYYDISRREVEYFGGREVNTTGDGHVATFDGPARAIHCARAVRDAIGNLGIRIRAGLHTGECELVGDQIGGIAVHIGARVASTADPDEILVSNTVKDLVIGSGLHFSDRGSHAHKGVPGEWRLFAAAV